MIAERPVICRLLESDRRLRDDDTQGALDQLDRAAARAADHADLRVAIALRRADALVRAERFEEAEREYRHLADPSGNDASPAAGAIALSRGGALRALDGDAEGARSAWRAALDAFRAMGVESPYWSLLRECSMLGPPVTRSPDVRRLLRELRDEPSTGGPMQTFRPRLRAEVPETWFAKESVTFLAPDGQANVIASSEPLDPSIDTERYASTQGDLLAKEFPGYEQHELRDTEPPGWAPGRLPPLLLAAARRRASHADAALLRRTRTRVHGHGYDALRAIPRARAGAPPGPRGPDHRAGATRAWRGTLT